MKKLLLACGCAMVASITAWAELSGVTYERATQTQVNTNNLSYVYTNRITASGITGLLSLQTMLEWFWLGETSYFENVWIAEDLVVGDDATIGGDLAVAGNLTAPTGTFSTLTVGSLITAATTLSQLTYSYQNTGTFTVASIGASATTFTASTQSIGCLHIGMYCTGSVFAVMTFITDVNYTTRVVTINKQSAGSGTGTSCSFWGNGFYTHVVPTGYSRCRVIVTGGGASGSADAGFRGYAGGAGGTSIGYWSLTPGVSYTVTVGAGGTNVSGTAVGQAGGTSSFGALQTATGGAAHPLTVADSLGGLGTGGQFNLSGGDGNENGGVSFWGQGAGNGDCSTTTNAVNFGSGGGGAKLGAGSGHGQFGIVTVEYY